jgi:hypothetical protein
MSRNRRDWRHNCTEPAGRSIESTSGAAQEEQAAAEKPAERRDSILGRLPKFFGWWLVIAGISSYV